ncbi:MAG: GTPase ObgE [Propionibacteriaceae bacterium]|nr:GTPase ObgE [Propionibacteriaceae bacterium]
MAIPSFVDRVKLQVSAGNGGNGCTSIRREKFKPLGGPDGGNGGNGGSVILRVEPGLTTLVEFHRGSQRRADNGKQGQGVFRNGANAEDIILLVPAGTVVTDVNTGEQLADLSEENAELVVAQGGRGGLGNAALATPARKAPGFALLGEMGESRTIQLELKAVADVGLVGFPSAGKSSLIAAVSRARPKIADYPFTTLVPHLGVVTRGDVTFTIADVPGLIEGASEGKGLGHDFLRHIERCRAIVHVIDCATYEPGRDPLSDLEVIEKELTAYLGTDDRPRMVALNKVDIPDAAELAELVKPDIASKGWPVFEISTKTGNGLKELTYAMAALVAQQRSLAPPEPGKRIVIRPKQVSADQEFSVEKITGAEGEFSWRIRGTKPERWVQQTDFSNTEAIGYLADRFVRIGIENELLAQGAQAGDEVLIGTGENPVIFDFAPQIESEAELLARRGEDQRLIELRPAAQRRRIKDAEYHAAKAEEAELDG